MLQQDDQPFHYKYRFLGKLGAGSFGSVFEAEERLTGQKYAVKRIPKSHMKSYDSLEFKLQKTLSHPNIVATLQNFQDSDYIYIKMELLKGGSLRQLINARGQAGFTQQEVACAARAILNSVFFLHRHNIIHRDIKPDNFILASCNDLSSLKLGDFGLSTQVFKHSELLKARGTPCYMSPEMALGLQCDKSVDLWCVGAVIYELLGRGELLFPQRKLQQIFQRLVNFTYQPRPDFSAEANSFLASLLQADPRLRMPPYKLLLHSFIAKNLQGNDLLSFDDSMQGCQDVAVLMRAFRGLLVIRQLCKQQKERPKENLQKKNLSGVNSFCIRKLCKTPSKVCNLKLEKKLSSPRISLKQRVNSTQPLDLSLENSKIKARRLLIPKAGLPKIDSKG